MKTLLTSETLKTLEGKVLKEGNAEVTIGLVLTNLLSNTTDNPHRAYQLAKQIATEKKVELKAEDIVYLKGILNKASLGALYTGQCIEILEASKEKENDK